MQKPAVLLVTADSDLISQLSTVLGVSYEMRTATSVVAALAALHADVDVVMTELQVLDGSGLELLRKLEAAGSAACGVLMTRYADYAAATRVDPLLEHFLVLFTPVDPRRVLDVATQANHAAERRRALRKSQRPGATACR